MKDFELLNEFALERVAGSEAEELAAAFIQKQVQQLGFDVEKEPFSIEFAEEVQASLEIVSPEPYVFEANGVGMAGMTDGVEAEFLYIDNLDAISLAQAQGKIVLFNGGLTYESYKKIIAAQAVGFITFNGDIYEKDVDIEERFLRPELAALGRIPGVTIRIRDAEKLVRLKPDIVKLQVSFKEEKRTSHNLVTTIAGELEETIVFVAHYDSVRHSKGVYDNATGVFALLDLLEHFAARNPKRTLKFIWCGAEERGLCGSIAYVREHQTELEKIRLVINIDMLGSVLGHDAGCATAEKVVQDYINLVAHELGHQILATRGVYPSDSTPFADAGIPAITFARNAAPNGPTIHSKKDVVDYLSVASFNCSVRFIIQFAERIIQSEIMPIPQTMPEDMKDELDKYLLRKFD